MPIPTLHWTLERRHADGSWKAVLSIPRAIEIYDGNLPGAQRAADDPIFGLLPSQAKLVRVITGWPVDNRKTLSRPGLPSDISAYTRDLLHGSGQYRHRTYTLGDLRSLATGAHRAVTCDQDVLEGADHLRKLTAILARNEWISEVLVGPVVDGPILPQHPAMARESAHAKLDRLNYSAGLLPISGETVRVCLSHQG